MLRALRIAVLPLLFLRWFAISCRQFPAPDAAQPAPLYAPMSAPLADAVFTSTMEIRALGWDGQTLWAATAGGVLRVQNGALTKWTRHEGLPSNEAFELTRENGNLVARFPTARAVWDGKNWTVQNAPEWKRRAPSANWNGAEVTATLDGLKVGRKSFALPPQASGTHISALLARGKVLLVAVYGDGLWRFDGKAWTRGPSVPDNARDFIARRRR